MERKILLGNPESKQQYNFRKNNPVSNTFTLIQNFNKFKPDISIKISNRFLNVDAPSVWTVEETFTLPVIFHFIRFHRFPYLNIGYSITMLASTSVLLYPYIS